MAFVTPDTKPSSGGPDRGRHQSSSREPDVSRKTGTLPSSAKGRSHPATRIPQTVSAPLSSTARRPSETVQTAQTRPPLTHESRSWASGIGSSGSSHSDLHATSSSATSFAQTLSTACNSRNRPKHAFVSERKPIISFHQQPSHPTRDTVPNPAKGQSSNSQRTNALSVPGLQPPLDYDLSLTQSPAEFHEAKKTDVVSTQSATIYPELDRYRHTQLPPDSQGTSHHDMLSLLATRDLPPTLTPLFSGTSSLVSGFSGSPSTRFSDSPGPGPYSRDTTPTSISSQSPNLVASVRFPATTRMRKDSRGRAPSFGKESLNEAGEGTAAPGTTHTLTAIRESLNSSSSSSNGTVRGSEKKDRNSKKKRLSPLPPSPPPRKSSQTFKTKDNRAGIPAKSSKPSKPAQPPHPAPSYKSAKCAKKSALESYPNAVNRHKLTAATTLMQHNQPQAPPARPSRDGTLDLQSQFGDPVPIIHSNLISSPLSERQTSLVSPALPLGTVGREQSNSPHNSPAASFWQTQQTRNQKLPSSSDSIQPSQLHLDVKAKVDNGTHSGSDLAKISTSTLAPQSETGQAKSSVGSQSARSPSPNVSAFRARFPLFGRRAKTAPTLDVVRASENREAPIRKGPAAGTGHEGYGRLGSGRRRSSSLSITAHSTASSQESLSNTQFQDPFLRDRLSPVVIAGGEIVENHNAKFDLVSNTSNTSIDRYQRPSTESKNGSQLSLSSREGGTKIWSSGRPNGIRKGSPSSSRSRRPSDSSDSDAVAMRSTLAFRRSVHRLQSADGVGVGLPRPITVHPDRDTAAFSVDSFDTGVMSDESLFDVPADISRGRKWSSSSGSVLGGKKLTKRAKSSRRWNLFGRSQSQPAKIKQGSEPVSVVAVTVDSNLSVHDTKPVAFYTMIDSSEQEDGDVTEAEDALRSPLNWFPDRLENNSSPTSRFEAHLPSSLSPPPQPSPQLLVSSQRQFYLRPPSPLKQQLQDIKKSVTNSPPASISVLPAPQIRQPLQPRGTARPGRPSRLPQVGRIPKVGTVRSGEASPRSFPKPSSNVRTPPQSGTLSNSDTVPTPLQAFATQLQFTQENSTWASRSVPRDRAPENEVFDKSREFLSFPPRQNSQTTSGTASSSSGGLSFADATAVIPNPGDPLVEDEVWDEYNDLLCDDAKAPLPTELSHGPSVCPVGGAVSNVNAIRRHTKFLEETGDVSLESPTIALHRQASKSGKADLSDRVRVSSSVYSSGTSSQLFEASQDNRSPTANQPPSTPFSVSEFVSGYGDRNNSIVARESYSTDRGNSGASQLSVQEAQGSGRSTHGQATWDRSPVSLVNLRVGSMTVSKWLTFGHVLFSPARDDLVPAVSPPNGHSVLVVDGLGNDDWSFYAAETYPAAAFFNLSPRAPLPVDRQSGGGAFPLSPPNHHQIQYTSHSGKLPFQSDIFTTVVYRFPAAAPEQHYRNIINESCRVLKPGGYLELSVLDFDLNNMGNRTRRAIRRLKEQIHEHTPDVHLGSTADTILRLLGSRGFTDIKSCRVGIPVASPVSRSDLEASTGRAAKVQMDGQSETDDRSLAEMISDKSPVADESITNVVTKVGRWWHNRCYGDAGMASAPGSSKYANGNHSIWNDEALLAECEEWGTSLKLMVCYARAPDIRRVASI